MAPVNSSSTPGHPRLTQLAHSSTSDSLSSLQNSPSSSRSTRNLGAIGGRAGPGYSPYARRVSRAAAAREEEEEQEDDATIRGDASDAGDSPVQQRSGLFGRVKSLPGKALGWLTRSSSSKTLSTSSSLADVRAEVEHEQAKEAQGDGMQRSRTTNNLVGQAGGTPSAVPSRLRRQPLQKESLPSSSSMSALSSIASPFAPSGLRSSHSTLNLASTAANGAAVPSFLTASNLSRHSRAVSPALSSASYTHSRRSPSPMRTGLAGSMSAFNLAQPRSPTSTFGADTTLGNAAISGGLNPFGLSSRSPFAPGAGRAGSQRAASVAGSVRSNSARPEGHALFPYTSTVPRGASPGIAASQSMREGLSSLASAPSAQTNSAPSTAQKRPYARVGSPLNPRSPYTHADGDDLQMNGVERARKKQMVWDPSRGLISRERLEAEKERDAPPLPKNEAERILEVLEGMGRTPLGEAKRGAVRPKKISVPAPVSPGLTSGARMSRSSNGPSNAPYVARLSSSNLEAASSGKGLQSVLRAREERRKALVEQEREERERERREKQERERRRDERRRELERLEREAEEEEELESVMSQDLDDEEERPKRRTRSSTAASKGKNLEPPTPRRSTRASSRTAAKSPSPLPTPKKKSRAKRAQEDEDQTEDVEKDRGSTRQKRPASKSPAPPSEATDRVESRSPPAPPKIVFPPPPAASSNSSNSSQRSSLRPGKSHSSRQHTASSKVFSAREEDLPPIDDDALSKIQMPAMKFPAGFSFGAATSAPTMKKQDEPAVPKKGDEAKAEGSSLLSRISSAPSAPAKQDKPAFSFASATPAASSSIPPLPAISFGNKPATSAPSASKSAEPQADFFAPKSASSGFSFASPSSSAPPASEASAPAPASGGEKPNFFASIVKEKAEETPNIAPLPAFSFGSTSSSAPVIKPTEVVTPEAEKEKKDASPAALPTANPFAAFGKPVSEIIKESQEGNKSDDSKASTSSEKAPEAAKPAFSFGSTAAKAEEKKADSAPATGSLFSFKPASSAPPAPSTTSPFTFGASKPADEPKKAEGTAAPAFSFGASASTPSASSAPSAPKATFTFGTTPATPVAEEKKESTPAPSAPASPFGALAPPAPASVAGTDDADGDSGMEDEAEPSTGAAKPSAPAPFTFGSAAPAASTPTSGLFGASSAPAAPAATGGFTFGASAEKKDSTSSPFGAPAASTASKSLFGGASSAPKPFTFGSPSPSPAPPSPAPAAASTPFSFGQPAAPTGASSSFTFGASSTSNPSPFGAPSQPASPAPASTGFSFGASASNPPASPAAPFTFGSTSGGNSTSMGQTLSAPGTNGAASPFGAAPSSGAFSFGSAASQPVSPSASTSGPSFNFGAAPAGGSSFSFGASTGSQTAPSPFGAPSAPAAGAPGGGFSFGAPTGSGATTPTGGGLFNLGSGGEDAAAKSGRPIRPLRRRK